MTFDNLTSNTTYVSNDFATMLLHVSLWALRIVCPLLILVAPVSNWICMRIFQSKIYARSSSRWYFIGIAIFDTVYVFVTAPLIFLISLNIFILNWGPIMCKLIIYSNYLSCQISAGLLACLSIDRLLATSCISFYRQRCSTHLSKSICISVSIFLSVVNGHYLIGYNIDSDGFCSNRLYSWYNTNYSRLNVVYLLSYSIIPFTIITFCNLFIVITVFRNKNNMKKYQTQQTSESRFSEIKSYAKKTKKADNVLKSNNRFKSNQEPEHIQMTDSSETVTNCFLHNEGMIYSSIYPCWTFFFK